MICLLKKFHKPFPFLSIVHVTIKQRIMLLQKIKIIFEKNLGHFQLYIFDIFQSDNIISSFKHNILDS